MDKNRLPKTSRPKRYEIKLDIDLNNFSYEGVENIELEVLENTNSIFLNSLGIEVTSASLEVDKKEVNILSVEYNSIYIY